MLLQQLRLNIQLHHFPPVFLQAVQLLIFSDPLQRRCNIIFCSHRRLQHHYNFSD